MPPVKKVLIDKTGKRFFVKDTSKDYHSQFGFIKAADLKKKAGSKVMTNKGRELTLLPPLFVDMYAKIKRGAQIIPIKDVSYIIGATGINRNSTVLDCGAGSGALTMALANIAKKVCSYEIREDFYNIVKENIDTLGFTNVSLKLKDITQGIDEKNLDLITLDMPTPWLVIEHAHKSLKPGGFLVSYSPTVPQVSDFVEGCRSTGLFNHQETIEISLREWEVDGRKVRPMSQGIGHSGFLSFFRKI